ncbi:MAG TPA: DHHA1 domain-containing protein [Candidatus Dormibacteraeota bacterium]|nr:DHHA1 domain-containing protein [Candidatus Dormibacteraeota bacterium]
MDKPLVIYHGDCPDGFGAAYAAWKRFGETATFVAARHGDPPPPVDGRAVLIADFSYPRPVLLALAERARELLVLDHHRSAQAELGDLPFCQFDMERSGAVMTWEHLHQEPVPPLLQYVQDRDLWRHALPETAEVSAALSAHPLDFQVWDGLSVETLRAEGLALLRYQTQLVDRMVARAHPLEILGVQVPAVNSPVLQSELGDRLATGQPFAAIWWQGGDGLARWSLRSTPAGADVSEIARRYGGGGHRNAAGFRATPPRDGRLEPPPLEAAASGEPVSS